MGCICGHGYLDHLYLIGHPDGVCQGIDCDCKLYREDASRLSFIDQFTGEPMYNKLDDIED